MAPTVAEMICIDDAAGKVNAEARQQPAADQSAHNTDAQIGDKAEPGATDDFAREPARNHTDNQNDKNAFAGHEFPLLKGKRVPREPGLPD